MFKGGLQGDPLSGVSQTPGVRSLELLHALYDQLGCTGLGGICLPWMGRRRLGLTAGATLCQGVPALRGCGGSKDTCIPVLWWSWLAAQCCAWFSPLEAFGAGQTLPLDGLWKGCALALSLSGPLWFASRLSAIHRLLRLPFPSHILGGLFHPLEKAGTQLLEVLI